jgi:CHAD domain-containing protein
MSMAAMRMLRGRHKSGDEAAGHGTTLSGGNLAGTVGDLAGALEHRLDGSRRGDPVDVHRARVASRRLREALALVGGDAAPAARAARRRVRRVRRALGEIREVDVTLALFEDEARQHAWQIPAAERVRGALVADRERRRRDMLRRLSRERSVELIGNLQQLASTLPVSKQQEAPVLSARLLKRSREFSSAIRRVGPLYRPEALHRVRIAGKKLRYALELVERHGHQPVSRDLATLRRWQALLGRLNDLHVLQTHLARIAADSPSHVMRRAIEAMDRTIEVECRGVHAKFLSGAPKLLLLARRVRLAGTTLGRPASERMARMSSARPAAVARAKFAKGA